VLTEENHAGVLTRAEGKSQEEAQLLAVESDPDAVLDLFELAVTWTELDYGDADVVPPESWVDFAADHCWRRPERVARLFALAADVALRKHYLGF